MSDEEDDSSALPQPKVANELSIFCRGCRHRLVHANSLRFLERDVGKKKPKLDLILLHTALKISQMLKVKDKVVYCAKCGAQVGKSGAPKGVPCRSIGFIDAGWVYAVLGKMEIREDKWSGKAHRMMSNSVNLITVEQLANSSKSQSASVSLIPKYVPLSAQSHPTSEVKFEPQSEQNLSKPEASNPTPLSQLTPSTELQTEASSSTMPPPPPKRLKPEVPVFL